MAIQLVEPSENLFQKVLSHLRERAKLLKIRRWFFVYVAALAGSAALLLPLIQLFEERFEQSNFGVFFSLLFTDREMMIASWQDFGYSLLESMPVVAILLTLAFILVVLAAVRFILSERKNVMKTYGY